MIRDKKTINLENEALITAHLNVGRLIYYTDHTNTLMKVFLEGYKYAVDTYKATGSFDEESLNVLLQRIKDKFNI